MLLPSQPPPPSTPHSPLPSDTENKIPRYKRLPFCNDCAEAGGERVIDWKVQTCCKDGPPQSDEPPPPPQPLPLQDQQASSSSSSSDRCRTAALEARIAALEDLCQSLANRVLFLEQATGWAPGTGNQTGSQEWQNGSYYDGSRNWQEP